jgi:hypothetical protein
VSLLALRAQSISYMRITKEANFAQHRIKMSPKLSRILYPTGGSRFAPLYPESFSSPNSDIVPVPDDPPPSSLNSHLTAVMPLSKC